jgi:LysM repeat protein
MADVIKENGLKDTNNIQAGAKLKIQPLAATEAPKQAATPEAPAVPEPTGSAAQEPAPEVKPDATPVPEAAPTEAPAPAQEETAAVPETPQAAPEAETADAPAAEGEYEYHVVQQGENLYRLAINCGTTKEELMRLNDLKDVTLVKVGARLKVPKKKP